MIARRGVLGVFGFGFVGLTGGCGLFGGNSYRFKMTVEVDTSQGIKTGSSVFQVTARKLAALTSEEAEVSDGLKGEAVIVDLTEGPVFVLLKSPQEALYLHRAATVALSGKMFTSLDELVDMVGDLGSWFGSAKAELPAKEWPLMVRFGDIKDPKSLEAVDPAAIGVKRIVLETTSDDVTTGIENRLMWLPAVYDMGIGPEFKPKGIPLGDFKRLFSTELEFRGHNTN